MIVEVGFGSWYVPCLPWSPDEKTGAFSKRYGLPFDLSSELKTKHRVHSIN